MATKLAPRRFDKVWTLDSLIERMRAARLKTQVLQRQETAVFLSSLKIEETNFKYQSWMDLERGSAGSRKVMGKRPRLADDYQRAYDALAQQAMDFSRSLSPVSLSEFADYFEIYWTMAEFDCASNPGAADTEEAFMAQVQVLGADRIIGPPLQQDWDLLNC